MELIKTYMDSPGIVTLALNRPEKRNALNLPLISALIQAIEKTLRSQDNRILIIKGEGPLFCAGLDLEEAKLPAKAEQSMMALAKMFETIHQCSLITIAAVHGGAYAGGAGIAAACDFIIAEKEALFCFPETKRGLVPALVAPLLMRQLSCKHLKELLLLGLPINAARGLEMGFVSRLAVQNKVMDEAFHFAFEILKGGPQATRMTKQLIEDLYPASFSDVTKRAMQYHHEARTSPEAREGIEAFFAKRAPVWIHEER